MEEIEIRSDEVQEILSHVPNWMIRWGITLIFGLIIMLLFLSWLIKYPEAIKGTITITTEQPSIRLVAQGSGLIHKLHVADGSIVKDGEVIAVLENPLKEDAVVVLKNVLDSLPQFVESESQGKYIFPQELPNFGDLQDAFNRLRTNSEEYFNWKFNDYTKERISNLKTQVKHYQQLNSIMNEQLKLAEIELKNASEKYTSDEALYKKGVISKIAFFEEQEKFSQRKQAYAQSKSNQVQNNITLNNIEKQLIELNFEQEEKLRQLQQEIKNGLELIANQITGWQQNFSIKASYNGRVNYLSNFNEQQFVSSGTPLFAILPNDNRVIGFLQIPSLGFGKIKKGQRVNIQLTNFPQHEFGQLYGEVMNISEIPTINPETKEGFYLVKVRLPNGLETSYHKKLDLTAEMIGTADVITEDLRVLERIFNQFRKLFDQ